MFSLTFMAQQERWGEKKEQYFTRNNIEEENRKEGVKRQKQI